MSKKQIRIKTSQVIQFVGSGQLLNFILKTGSVVLAVPLEFKDKNLKVKNTRGHKLQLPLSQIEEIWADEKVVS
ncbi:hypothetical protein [Marinoscillum sp. MHG1-6]|uniref:hypothetical protein n=1 Tax=Marinoscillum sp. MHG1-6 TaxID=2959627 RepID=UPI0021572E3C|nr:hypothetical protein [Marinoscillum sp. MHG1-6]